MGLILIAIVSGLGWIVGAVVLALVLGAIITRRNAQRPPRGRL